MFPKPMVFRQRWPFVDERGVPGPLSWICVTHTALTDGGVSFHESWASALDHAKRWWSSFD